MVVDGTKRRGKPWGNKNGLTIIIPQKDIELTTIVCNHYSTVP